MRDQEVVAIPDVYTNITDAAPAILEGLMTVLELRHDLVDH